MKTILIVEDEQDILDLLEYTLSKEGYDVICCINTSNVKKILEEENISLIIMDRNLPGIEGSVFINQLKKEGLTTPVIYLSAKDKDDDIIEGFNRGADDYITKPFSLNIVKARIKAVLARTSINTEELKVKDIIYKIDSKQFFIENKEIILTSLEHDLLLEFIKNKNILLSRDTLLENVWGDYLDVKPKTVNVAIKRLKEKIDPTGEKNYIKAIRGQGYIFA